jgi:hypothetical protein
MHEEREIGHDFQRHDGGDGAAGRQDGKGADAEPLDHGEVRLRAT